MKALAMIIILRLTRTISGTPSVSPTNQTILVAVDSPLEIIFSSTQIYPCDATCDSEKIQMSLNNVWGCQLNFDRDTGTMTRDNFSKQPCKDSRSDSWRATTSNPPHADDIYLKIERAHAHDSGIWDVGAKPEAGDGDRILVTAYVTVAAAPEEMSFVDADDVANDDYNDGEVTLSQNETYVIERIFCKATRVRPEPTFIWTVDDVDINLIPELQNATTEATTSEVSQVTETDKTEYFDMTQELGLPVIGWLDSKVLGCRVAINDSNGNNLVPNASPADLTLNVTFVVEARPVPSTDPEIFPEGTFSAGEEGVLVIHFHSNPEPRELSWYPYDMSGNLTSTEANATLQSGRYTSHSWVKAVDCLHAIGSDACVTTYTPSNPSNAYVAILKISELKEDDQNYAHNLTISNSVGTTTYAVRIQTIEVGLTTGAIVGIVAGCVVGVILIAGLILLFVRHRNGKKSKKIRQKKKESRAEERTDRL